MAGGPRAPVQAPLVEPARVGLLASARLIETTDERWENGFSFEPENCGTARGIVDPCGTETKTIPANDDSDRIDVDPYVIWAGDRCSSFGFASRDYAGKAMRLLRACESAQIEEEFWTGTQITTNRNLADPLADVVTPGAAQTPQIALRCLEEYLAECLCGGQGMIHATRQLVSAWSENGLIRRENGQTLTINDTIIVAGAGYDGSSPDGEPQASGSVWAYATGRVHVRLSPIEVFPRSFDEALNRTTNVIEFRAERMAAAYTDWCCHGAARVNLELCALGGS